MAKKLLPIFVILILAGCDSLYNMPNQYLLDLLADATECESSDLVIESERYEYPSTIWFVKCGDKRFACSEYRYGFDLTQGNTYTKIFCEKR